jgi:hypothetical protein
MRGGWRESQCLTLPRPGSTPGQLSGGPHRRVAPAYCALRNSISAISGGQLYRTGKSEQPMPALV